MSKNKKSKDTKTKPKGINLQIGNSYIVKIKDGYNFSGILVTKCESLKENGIMMSYRFYLGRTKYIDLHGSEIKEINKIY